MAVFQVDSAQVSLAAATAEQSSAAIQTEVEKMMAFLRGLESSWGGMAAASFQGVIEQWQATQVQVDASLLAISSQLNLAAQTYSDAESAAASMFAG